MLPINFILSNKKNQSSLGLLRVADNRFWKRRCIEGGSSNAIYGRVRHTTAAPSFWLADVHSLSSSLGVIRAMRAR